MPRKPTAIVQYKLRIREALRRRIEAAAKARRVSANAEMAQRLEQSFEQQEHVSVALSACSLEVITARLGELLHPINVQGDLLRAVEELLAVVEESKMQKRPEVEAAVTKVKRVTTMIDLEAKALARRAHTTGERPPER